MKTGRTVREYMATNVVTLRADMTIHEAIQVLLAHRFSGAPVVDEEGRLVGVLSNRDCIRVSFDASYYQQWGGRVADAMSSPVVTVEADADIVEVAERFLGKLRRYPVLDSGRFVGQISRHDILRALADLWGQPPEAPPSP